VVLSGPVSTQAPAPAPIEEIKPLDEKASPAAKATQPPDGAVRIPPGPGEDRFLVSSAAAQSLPPDVAAELAALAGEVGIEIVALLDGSRTTGEIAHATGLHLDQVSAVVKVLVSHKLAFRYVSRARRPTGVQTPG
jgi:hypothetical protein